MTLAAIAAIAALIAAHWRHAHQSTLRVEAALSQLQGVPVVRRVDAPAQRVVCPACETSYTFRKLNITKTGPADHALVQCVCEAEIAVSFDPAGNAQCQV